METSSIPTSLRLYDSFVVLSFLDQKSQTIPAQTQIGYWNLKTREEPAGECVRREIPRRVSGSPAKALLVVRWLGLGAHCDCVVRSNSRGQKLFSFPFLSFPFNYSKNKASGGGRVTPAHLLFIAHLLWIYSRLTRACVDNYSQPKRIWDLTTNVHK